MTLNYRTTDPIPMTVTAFDLHNIAKILAEPSRYDWFNAQLLRLCQKADRENMRKIASAFPDVAAAFLIYWTGGIPESFHDVIPNWEYYLKTMTSHIKGDRS